MAFEFVDNTAIDRRARKLIRSHAAKGKNVGRKISRPSRPKIPPAHWRQTRALEPLLDPESNIITGNSKALASIQYPQSEARAPVIGIEHQIGDEFSLILFPFEATPRARSLVRRVLSFITNPLYPPELCLAVDFTPETGHFMIEKIFRDEACFYCAAAMSTVSLNSLPLDQEAMGLVAFTFRLLNKKLSGNDALKDPTIAAVVAMTQYERLRGEYQHGLIHLEGIRRMVELRGGISRIIISRPGLAQKIFRADFELALYLGCATTFHAEDLPGNDTVSWLRANFIEGNEHQLHESEFFRKLNPRLLDILVDISGLAWFLDGRLRHEIQLSGYIFHDVLLLFGYRLIQISPLCGFRPARWIENALQVGLTVFMSSFLIGLGGVLPDYPPLSQLACTTARQYSGEDEESQEIFLWMMLVGAASVFSQQHDDMWLILRIKQTTLALDLHNWEAVSQKVSKFPWVNALHYKPAKLLWNRSRSQYLVGT